jgi:hypothetical protein
MEYWVPGSIWHYEETIHGRTSFVDAQSYQIESDTSKVATGTVLTQLDLNGNWHPIAFLSKTFSETKRKYKIYDRGLLGIIQALKEWKHYIQGSGHMMIVYSDHKNLTYFQTAQKLNDRQARWLLYLSGFDLKLIHLLGTKMVQSDALQDWKIEEIDGQKMIFFKGKNYILKDLELWQDIVKMYLLRLWYQTSIDSQVIQVFLVRGSRF